MAQELEGLCGFGIWFLHDVQLLASLYGRHMLIFPLTRLVQGNGQCLWSLHV